MLCRGREWRRRVPAELLLGHQAAHQRIAVGMHARRRQPDQHVAGRDVGPRQNLAALHGAHGETRRGRSPPPRTCPGISAVSPPISAQPACRQPSAMPATTARAVADVELAGGEIVQEEQRLGALHQQVVDAHGDEIDADGVVPAGLDGDLELGADAVVGGDQDRVLEAGRASGRTARRSRRDRHPRPAGASPSPAA